MAPRAGHIAARLRAARGYKGLKQPELAKMLGISVETLSRMENGATTVPDERVVQIAKACEVPLVFMQVGFAPLDRPMTDIEARVHNLETDLAGRLARTESLLDYLLKSAPGSSAVTDADELADKVDATGEMLTGEALAPPIPADADSDGEADAKTAPPPTPIARKRRTGRGTVQ